MEEPSERYEAAREVNKEKTFICKCGCPVAVLMRDGSVHCFACDHAHGRWLHKDNVMLNSASSIH